MKKKSISTLLEDELAVLVQHFGVTRVKAALMKVSSGTVDVSGGQAIRPSSGARQKANPSVSDLLDRVGQEDQEKRLLLTDFYTQLKDGNVLPESQDIHQFAQLIGLKEIDGKSRRDMIPKLMRFLIDQPAKRLQFDIKKAANASERQRQQGFSILTDKLVGR